MNLIGKLPRSRRRNHEVRVSRAHVCGTYQIHEQENQETHALENPTWCSPSHLHTDTHVRADSSRAKQHIGRSPASCKPMSSLHCGQRCGPASGAFQSEWGAVSAVLVSNHNRLCEQNSVLLHDPKRHGKPYLACEAGRSPDYHDY